MDKQTGIAALVAAVTGVFSAGAFKFYEFVLKQKREIKSEEEAAKAMYRDDLINRVEKLEAERNENMAKIMELMTTVSAMKVEVDYLKRENEVLKLKIDALR